MGSVGLRAVRLIGPHTVQTTAGTTSAEAWHQPDVEDAGWFASVSLLDEGGYEVELRDTRNREHEMTVQHDTGRIAKDVTVWLASRNRQ